MLNPTTADSTPDDPTIRRCRDAKLWDGNGLVRTTLDCSGRAMVAS
jgi:hypothetical protein